MPLLALAAAGCASNVPGQPARAGSPYVEEIKSPAPLLFDPNCVVR